MQKTQRDTISGNVPGARAEEGATIVGSSYRADNDGPGPRVMGASTLNGDDVVNRQGEKLGTIEEIMLDVPTGRIAYAVLSSGGLLGIGDKLFAIPWRSLTLDPENKCFLVDVAKERLEQAPGFDKDHWPSMADENWARELHTYYRVRPYWE
jgi:sporulation protein YlmC with PRC-barrel domain